MEKDLAAFKNLLLDENKKQNLVSRKTTPDEIDLHILDSLSLMQINSLKNENLVDIGSGAGFPGLILGLVSRETFITLIESDQKKSQFLQNCIKSLQIKNIRVVRNRVETLGHDPLYREKFTLCTGRAVANLQTMLEYALPLLQLGGKLYLWKGPKYQEELIEAKKALEILGGTLERVYSYSLGVNKTRVLLEFTKISLVPEEYPRKNGIPSKRPL